MVQQAKCCGEAQKKGLSVFAANTHAAAGCEVWRYFLSIAFDRAKGNSRQATGLLQATALISLPLLTLVCLPHTHVSQLVLVSALPAAVNVISGPKVVVGGKKDLYRHVDKR